MKKFLLLTLSFISFSVHSQIDIKDNVKLKAIDNSKIGQYDSLFDFGKQQKNSDYLKFIGQELFLPPLSSKNKKGVDIGVLSVLNLRTIKPTEHISDTAYAQENLRGIYDGYYDEKAKEIASDLSACKVTSNIYNPFISIIIGNPSNTTKIELSREIFNKNYKIIDITDTRNESLRTKTEDLRRLRLWLQTETNDTIYFDKDLDFADQSLNPFLVKGFYDYHKKNYVGKKLFVFRDSEQDFYGKPKDAYVDLNTGEEITLKTGELWNCDEISFINLPYQETLSPFYILSKGNQQIKIKLGELFKSGLLTLEELDILYNHWLQEKNERIKEKEEQLEKVKNDCQQKFSESHCDKLLKGQIELGMTKEMILYAYGTPYKIFTAQSTTGVNEIYSYGGTVIFFKNEKVVAVEQYH
ncbi:hypothetical protein RM549_15710 [Salegentibacter sp. F188]|uniref:Uncharacterized protein n=1 Tax=Autumnicola patrickiae TaxID=3075591 RepID=A0ABU3E7N2_9FLAO|nr:hypothetical protein [Salegentibacter sp. F188]MDT0691242.1 hypothetical protein [Salegentibacter sp. F188]